MWDIAALTALILCCVAGLGLAVVRLPGTWVILLAAAGYGWWSQWERVGLWTVGVLAGLALLGEAIELVMSIWAARRAGASRQAVWGGLIGGFAGMFLLSFIVPIPVVGTVVGALLGCFAGAAAGEWLIRRRVGQGAKVGVFAAMGFALGMAAKLAVALVMSALVLTKAVWPADRGDEPAQEASISSARAHTVEDDSDTGRARNRAFVMDLQQLDHLCPNDPIGGGHPLFLVDEPLDHLVPDRDAVLGRGFNGKNHREGVLLPFAFDGVGARGGHAVEPHSLVTFQDVVPGQESDRAKHG